MSKNCSVGSPLRPVRLSPLRSAPNPPRRWGKRWRRRPGNNLSTPDGLKQNGNETNWRSVALQRHSSPCAWPPRSKVVNFMPPSDNSSEAENDWLLDKCWHGDFKDLETHLDAAWGRAGPFCRPSTCATELSSLANRRQNSQDWAKLIWAEKQIYRHCPVPRRRVFPTSCKGPGSWELRWTNPTGTSPHSLNGVDCRQSQTGRISSNFQSDWQRRRPKIPLFSLKQLEHWNWDEIQLGIAADPAVDSFFLRRCQK